MSKFVDDVLKIADPKTGEIKYIVSSDGVKDLRPRRKSRFFALLQRGIRRISSKTRVGKGK